MTAIDQGDGYDVHGEPVRKPATRCPVESPHPAHDWILNTDGVENHRCCSGRPGDDLSPQQRPTSAVAHALRAQVGDIVTWGSAENINTQYRWNGEQWRDLEVGDACRNARDGSVMIWAGPAGWRKPHISRADIDELATVIDPQYPHYVDDQPQADAAYYIAERVLTHGYTHTLRAPAIQPAAYHFPRVPYRIGDPVDVTWSNGHTTRHTIESVGTDGELTLRNRA